MLSLLWYGVVLKYIKYTLLVVVVRLGLIFLYIWVCLMTTGCTKCLKINIYTFTCIQ